MGRQGRIRQESALRRGRPSRRPRECIHIVCEGTVTEPSYFGSLWQAIRLNTVEVEIAGEGAEISKVIDAAIRRREERADEARNSPRFAPFDEVWCVVDTERRNDNASWERGVNRAASAGLKLAWSNPCFEYWLLLHFEKLGRSFDGYAAIRPRVRQHIKHYEKNLDCFEQLAPRIATAIEHSKQIHRAQWQDTPKIIDRNPATDVHLLVEKLIEVAEMTVEQYQERYPLPEPVRPKGKRARRP
jgi:RloB-like protein